MRTASHLVRSLVALGLLAAPLAARADSLSLSQVNFNLDDNIYTNTAWAQIDFNFTGFSGIKYLNVALSGSWQVQNIPVISYKPVGDAQTISYYADLGNTPGTLVTSADYAFSLTDDVLAAMPTGTLTAPVSQSQIAWWSGLDGGGTETPFSAPEPLIGGKAAANAKPYAHPNFPNQQAGKNECVPAAVSNSLQFLVAQGKVAIPADKTTIAALKPATNWGPNGSPTDTWFNTKAAAYAPYGVTTRKVTDLGTLAAELADHQDIEIIETWTDKDGKKRGHATALVSIVPTEDGGYTLTVVDDRVQGDDTQGTDNPRTYQYKNGRFFEAGFGYTNFAYAIVECPEPASLAVLGLGVLTLLTRRRR